MIFVMLIVFIMLVVATTSLGTGNIRVFAGFFLLPGGIVTSRVLASGPAAGRYYIALMFIFNVLVYGPLCYLIVALAKRLRAVINRLGDL